MATSWAVTIAKLSLAEQAAIAERTRELIARLQKPRPARRSE
jgi:hypothetical protein